MFSRPIRVALLGAALAMTALTGCGQEDPGTPAASSTAATSVTATTSTSVTRPTPTPTDPTPTDPTPTTGPGGPTTAVSVYFMKNEKLVPTRRQVATPAVAQAALTALLAGPTAAESSAGMSSSIPAGTTLRGVSLRAGTATVDLSGAFASGGGTLSMTSRLAQVVFTATRFGTIQRVDFRLDGVPVTVFGGEGIILDHPQTRADFEDLSPAVLVESPTSATTAGSPLRVYGTANTFEAVFQLQVVDTAGATLTDTRVMASSGTGTRGTFDVTLRFTVTTPGTGKLVAWFASARDGSRVVVAEIPLDLRR